MKTWTEQGIRADDKTFNKCLPSLDLGFLILTDLKYLLNITDKKITGSQEGLTPSEKFA